MRKPLPFNLHDRASLARRLAEATIGGAAIRVLGAIFALLIGVQLARYLGPGGFGIYGTVTAIVAVLAVATQLGLPQLITRDVSTRMASDDVAGVKARLVWFGVMVLGFSILVAIAGLLGLTIWPTRETALRQALWWGILSLPLVAFLNLLIGAIRGLHHVVVAQIFDGLLRPAVFVLLLAAAAILGEVDAPRAVAMQALAAFFAAGSCIYWLARAAPKDTIAAPLPAYRRDLARGACPMLITELLRVVDGQYLILLLGVIAGLHDVGLIRVAIAVIGFVALPSTLINVVVMSFVADLHARNDRPRLQLLAAGSAGLMFASVALITVVLFCFGETLLTLVFGSDFAGAWAPLCLMGVAYTVNAFFGSAATILNMAGQERTVTAVYAVGPVIGAIFTVVLFGRLGISAAGVAMILAELTKGIWMAFAARQTLGLNVTIFALRGLLQRTSNNQCLQVK